MKKKIVKKVVSIFLATGMVVASMTGCSNVHPSSNSQNAKTEEKAESSEEPYTVHYLYLVAQEGADQDAVEAAVDKLAMKELNMHVDLIPLTWGTYATQLQMMLASNEDLDIFPGLSNQFSTYIDSGYVVNLDQYKDLMPDVFSTLGEDAKAGYIGNFLIGFSNMKERAYPAGIIVRKDIFEKLGYKVDDFNISTDDYNSFEQITEMFSKVHKAYPNMVCLDGTGIMGNMTNSYMDNLGSNFGVLENYGQTTTVTNWFASDQFKNFCNISKKWYDAGYESQDISVNTDSGEIKMKAGNCFSYISQIKPNSNIEKLAQTGYDVEIIPISKEMKNTNAVNADLLCIANASKNPAKAAKFMNWTYKSKEFNDLINWGIEGKDWVESKDGMAEFPNGVNANSVGYHNDFGYIYPNQFAGHAWEGNPTDIWKQYEIYNNGLMKSKAFGLTFDSTSVATQEAQLNAVSDQYLKDLAFGTVKNVDSKITEFNDALYAAGLQDVMDAKQSQVDKFLASKE